jgi:hypothetical protein
MNWVHRQGIPVEYNTLRARSFPLAQKGCTGKGFSGPGCRIYYTTGKEFPTESKKVRTLHYGQGISHWNRKGCTGKGFSGPGCRTSHYGQGLSHWHRCTAAQVEYSHMQRMHGLKGFPTTPQYTTGKEFYVDIA